MLHPEMLSIHRMFMFFYALMEVAASVPNKICIAQITCEFVEYTLLDTSAFHAWGTFYLNVSGHICLFIFSHSKYYNSHQV